MPTFKRPFYFFTPLLFYFYLYLCLKIKTHSMNVKLRGTLCGVGAAVFYGTNPLGAMNLYHDGISANSTLFYRFGLAIVMLGVMMLVQRKKFGVTRSELMLLAMLGVFMGSSSSSLFISFNYMDVGIASTLLFVYPVMVAVIMALLFKEKVTPATVISIALALGGIALLNQTSDGSTLSTLGVLLVMVSSLTYAVYIVVVNKSRLRMSSVKLTFYVLIFGLLTILGYTFAMGETVQLLTTPHQWLFAAQLALMPTVLSLVLMAIYAFEKCEVLKKVIMSKELTTLGPDAFYNCNNLKSLRFYDKLEKLGTYSFGFYYHDEINLIEDEADQQPSDELVSDFVVYAPKDSVAYHYAKDYGIKVKTGTIEIGDANVSVPFLIIMGVLVIGLIIALILAVTAKSRKAKKEEKEMAKIKADVAEKLKAKKENKPSEEDKNEDK